MKYTLQITNIGKPNSKHNTFTIGVTETKDHTNIAKCMTHFSPQLDKLSELEWRGKKMMFIFGDYDFLTKLYGLSEANGMFPCLWCNASKDDIHRGIPSMARSLDVTTAASLQGRRERQKRDEGLSQLFAPSDSQH